MHDKHVITLVISCKIWYTIVTCRTCRLCVLVAVLVGVSAKAGLWTLDWTMD